MGATTFFIQHNGVLMQVQPLTRGSVETPSVKVRIIRTAQIMRVSATAIIINH